MAEDQIAKLDKSAEKNEVREVTTNVAQQEATGSRADLVDRQRQDMADQKNSDRAPKPTSQAFGRMEITGDDGKALVKGMEPEKAPDKEQKIGTTDEDSMVRATADTLDNVRDGFIRAGNKADYTRSTAAWAADALMKRADHMEKDGNHQQAEKDIKQAGAYLRDNGVINMTDAEWNKLSLDKQSEIIKKAIENERSLDQAGRQADELKKDGKIEMPDRQWNGLTREQKRDVAEAQGHR